MFRKALMIAVIGSALFSLTSAHAHSGAEGVIKERMELMKSIGKNVKMIAPIATGAADMNLKAVEEAALAISEAAATAPTKFTKGSLSKESEAKAEIWDNWAEFEGLLNNLSADAAKLSQLAKAGEEFELAEQFGKMTKNCKACHTKFREKKE
jgi:cytochrome c556